MSSWAFDPDGPDSDSFEGPSKLSRKGLGLPPSPGLYLITCGDCLAHVGTSGKLRSRVGTLARLGAHRGSAEVLCAAFCTGLEPQVRWRTCPDIATAGKLESDYKQHYREPPTPRERYEECVNGRRLMRQLLEAAGENSWEAGFIEATFIIGEKLNLLFQPRLWAIWEKVGIPPGPWATPFRADNLRQEGAR